MHLSCRKMPFPAGRCTFLQKMRFSGGTGQEIAGNRGGCQGSRLKNASQLSLLTTLGQFLANSPPHGKLQGSSLQYGHCLGTPNPYNLSKKYWHCDPRVPLQRSKLENRENDIFGVKKCLFWGRPWNHLNGVLGAFNSLP